MISNNGHDENGKYNSGKAGDQTGTEWVICNWYDSGWKCVLRHPDPTIREMIATHAEKAANNNNCGYDMYERYTYGEALKAAKEDPSKIDKPCESDCSSGITANVKSIGRIACKEELANLPHNLTTHGMRSAFKKAGFEVLTAAKYLKSDAYLLRGDIILNDDKHVTTNLTTGSKVKIQNEPADDGMLRRGSKGDAVKMLQTNLNSVMNAGLDVDGSFGPKTEAAVKDFQKKFNLEVDGIYGPKSTEAMTKALSTPKTYKYKVKGVTSFLNIRADKTSNSASIGKLYNGDIIDTLYTEGKWAKLAGAGWVYTDFIEKV